MCMMPDTYRGTYRDEIGLVNNIPNNLVYRVDAACDPHGEVVTGLEEELEYKCPECGTFLPASTMRCPRCRTEYKEEEETVEELIEELALPLKGDVKEEEVDNKASIDETTGLPKKVPKKKGGTSKRARRKLTYKQVSQKPR